MQTSFIPIQKLLTKNIHPWSKWISLFGLWLGFTLVLISLQFFLNLQIILGDHQPKSDGNEFVSIAKTITNKTMGNVEANSFVQREIDELNAQDFIISASPLVSNQFRVQLSAAGMLGFRTDFFVESIDTKFLGNVPEDFKWEVGSAQVPLIISNTFLELYNVFAPSYGLPQFSKETIYNIPLNVICYDPLGKATVFYAKIVGTTDRINSVIVPTNFLEWANNTFSNVDELMSSRVYLELKSLDDPQFITFLENKNYSIQNDKVQFGKVKQILNGVLGSIGAIGIFTLLLSILLFSFYLNWMLAKNQESLRLLTTISYSPKWMVKKLNLTYLPIFILITVLALLSTAIFHYIFVNNLPLVSSDLPIMISIFTITTAIIIFISIVLANHRTLKKVLYEYSA